MRLLEQLLNTGDGGIEHIGDVLRPFIFIGAAFGNFKYPRFRQIQQVLAGAPLGVETGFGDFVGHRNHFTHHCAFAHDVGIRADVRRAWRIFGELGQIGEAANAIQLPLTLKRFGEGDQVNRAT